MIVEVEMRAFGGGAIREVWIPDQEVTDPDNIDRILDLAFQYGQNDFQPRPLPSVSVGDVIRCQGRRFVVKGMGFQEVGPDEARMPDPFGGLFDLLS